MAIEPKVVGVGCVCVWGGGGAGSRCSPRVERKERQSAMQCSVFAPVGVVAPQLVANVIPEQWQLATVPTKSVWVRPPARPLSATTQRIPDTRPNGGAVPGGQQCQTTFALETAA
jgi:hypothetical protein